MATEGTARSPHTLRPSGVLGCAPYRTTWPQALKWSNAVTCSPACASGLHDAAAHTCPGAQCAPCGGGTLTAVHTRGGGGARPRDALEGNGPQRRPQLALTPAATVSDTRRRLPKLLVTPADTRRTCVCVCVCMCRKAPSAGGTCYCFCSALHLTRSSTPRPVFSVLCLSPECVCVCFHSWRDPTNDQCLLRFCASWDLAVLR